MSLTGDNLLKDITLVGGNDSGIFISSVQSGSVAEKVGLREGHHLLLVCSVFPEQMMSTFVRVPSTAFHFYCVFSLFTCHISSNVICIASIHKQSYTADAGEV